MANNKGLWGEIICDRVPWSRSINRFVDKQIHQWLKSHREDERKGGHYHVVFERISLGHSLGCHVELEIGDKIWRGSDYSQGLHQSLIQTLNHMSPVPRMGS